MIYYIYPKYDSTIYEDSRYLNAGLDSILEIGKFIISTGSIVSTSSINNSRALLKFDYTDLNLLSDLGYSTSSAEYNLQLFTTDIVQSPTTYTFIVHPISSSWSPGLGKMEYSDKITEGVNWRYVSGTNSRIEWATASFNAGTTGSYISHPGGGNWYTSSVSKSFGYNDTSDVNINITSLVAAHISGTIPNNGFIIKRTDSEELSLDDTGRFKFFSVDTNTIYPPRIKVSIKDAIFYTGSNPILPSGDNIIYFKNLNSIYTDSEIVQIQLVGREKYPIKTFSTSSVYLNAVKLLPSSSFYAIKDLQTEETVIDFTDFTRLSCSGSYNYFTIFMGALQTERYYRVQVKVNYSSTDTRVYDSNNIFKVVR